jgi:hypothetical protein
MPARPPTVLHKIELTPSMSPPQSIGMKLPAVEPMNTPIQMSDLVDTAWIILYFG